jgi:hypothetical protein
MASLTQAEVKNKLLEATSFTSQTKCYMDRLVPEDLSLSKSRAGRQVYPGRIQDFHMESIAVARELVKKYDSWTKVYKEIKTQETFKKEQIENLIAKWGPVIWDDNTPDFLTLIYNKYKIGTKSPYYRHHLVYNNEEDRQWLVTNPLATAYEDD